MLFLFIQHTSAALTINENFDSGTLSRFYGLDVYNMTSLPTQMFAVVSATLRMSEVRRLTDNI